MTRRTFLHQGSTALAVAAAASYVPTTFAAEPKPKRVGLIGTGWYGKSDLFRLMQVAPVEVVSLCDVDKRLLSDCADTAAKKNRSGKRPRLYSDYRQMLAEYPDDAQAWAGLGHLLFVYNTLRGRRVIEARQPPRQSRRDCRHRR